MDGLVLADGAAEDNAVLGVSGGAIEGDEAEADGFGGDEDSFGVEAVEEVFEAPALFADEVGFGDFEVVDEELVGVDGFAAHFVDFADFDAAAVEFGVEQAEAVCAFFDMFDRGGAGEEEHALGDLGGADPDFLAVGDVAVAVFFGAGFEVGGVEAGVGFGDGEAGFFAPGDEGGEEAAFLFVGAVDDDGLEAEDVDVDGRGAGHAGAGLGDGLHHDGGFGEAEAGAAVFLGHADAEPAAGGEGCVKCGGEAGALVVGAPVVVAEIGADAFDGGFDAALLVGEFEVHGGLGWFGLVVCRGGRREGRLFFCGEARQNGLIRARVG